MAEYYFKLLGGFGERSEADIEVDFDLLVSDVKTIVRQKFRLIPSLQIDLMVGGRKLSDDMKWGMTDAKPSSSILVIGHRD